MSNLVLALQIFTSARDRSKPFASSLGPAASSALPLPAILPLPSSRRRHLCTLWISSLDAASVLAREMAVKKQSWRLAVVFLFLLALLRLSVADISYPPFSHTAGVTWRPAAAAKSTCSFATFAFDATIPPADWRQCAALYSSWTGEKGSFRLAASNDEAFVPVIQMTDCTLGMEPVLADLGPYTVGSKDVEALLGLSLRNYSSGTLLAAGGIIKCDAAAGGRADLRWRISSSITG